VWLVRIEPPVQKIGDRIKVLRKRLGYTQKEFCAKAGVPLRTLASIEINERKPGFDLLVKFAKIARTSDVDLQWFMFGEEGREDLPQIVAGPNPGREAKTDLISIPVINEVPAGYPGYPKLDDEIHGFLYLPGIRRHCFGLFVRGESMLPELADQDIVVVDPAIKAIENGKIGVFRVHGDATIKICMPLEEGEGYILQPRNPTFQPILITGETECTVIGKVIYKIVHCE